MIPANYTRDSFSDFLQFEVMLESAPELGWVGEINTPFDPTTPIVTRYGAHQLGQGKVIITIPSAVSSPHSSTTQQSIEVFPYSFIPAGTKISLGTNPTTTFVVTATDTFTGGPIEFTSAVSTSTGTLTKGEFYYTGPDTSLITRHPIYDKIIDETLLRMGIDDIEMLDTPAELFALRMYGRREVWRMAMQALAADYNYSSIDGLKNRMGVYDHIKHLFLKEDERVRLLFNETAQSVSDSTVRRFTENTQVIARW